MRTIQLAAATVVASLFYSLIGGISLTAAADHPLMAAVKMGDASAAQRLLAEGEDPDIPQGDGATALLWASHRDDLVMASLLMDAGADPNTPDAHGVTALALACLNGSVPMVEFLLDAGADPNLARTNGVTPLMTASRVGNVDVVRRLLAASADPTAGESRRGQTALMWAAAEGHVAVANVLLETGGGATRRSANGFTPLLFAAQQGNRDIARLLLTAGAGVDEAAPDGIGGDTNARTLFRAGTQASALLVAIDSGHAAMALFLIEEGADPNHHGAGRTALHAATQQEMPEVVRALLAAGADPNARLTKRTPYLSRYIRLGNGLVPDLVGATPFWLAASYGDLEIMQILVDAGADPVLRSRDGTTALMVAAGADYVEGQDKYGRRSFPAYYETLQQRALEAIKYCLDLGLDINAVNDNGQTPLHGGVYIGGTLIVPFLVAQGAQLDVINRRGQTPWMIAAQGEYRAGSFNLHEDTARFLEELGADTTIGFDLGIDFRDKLTTAR